jgi:hypothetical protein
MLQLKKNGDEGDEGHDKGGVGRSQVVLRGGDQGRKASTTTPVLEAESL